MNAYGFLTTISEKIGSGEIDGNKDIMINGTDFFVMRFEQGQINIENVRTTPKEEPKIPKKKKRWFKNA